jgi:hypothetical protein
LAKTFIAAVNARTSPTRGSGLRSLTTGLSSAAVFFSNTVPSTWTRGRLIKVGDFADFDDAAINAGEVGLADGLRAGFGVAGLWLDAAQQGEKWPPQSIRPADC